MISPTQLLAQCIHIGDPGPLGLTPTSVICGPFPTAIPTVPFGPTPVGGYCPTGNCFETPGDPPIGVGIAVGNGPHITEGLAGSVGFAISIHCASSRVGEIIKKMQDLCENCHTEPVEV
jgi:hypothetical protein